MHASGGFNITYNYLVTDSTGKTTRVSSDVYEAGLFAAVDVIDDVSRFSAANRLQIVVHGTYLDVRDAWVFGRVLARTYSDANDGTITV